MAVFYSHSSEETLAFGQRFAKTLKAGDVVLLEGEMGAGKTALAKGIAKGLGVRDEVTSPTYAYVNAYRGRLPVYHYDCYRIVSEEQAYLLGLSEPLEAGGVCLIEWGKNISGLLPETCKTLLISGVGDEREIEFEDPCD